MIFAGIPLEEERTKTVYTVHICIVYAKGELILNASIDLRCNL